jgi:preprotein translocase subunit SecG
MQWLSPALLAIQVISALAIIVLVLLQQGKGSEMGAAFGSGSAGSLFGASGSANFLSRTTAVLAAIFFVTSLGLTYLSSNRTESKGVIERTKDVPQPKKEAPSSVPAPSVPVPAAPAEDGSKASEVPK